MYIDVERYVDFIANNKLTQNQFLFLYCLKNKNYNAIRRYMEAFPTGDGTMIGEANKQDLIDREFIAKCGEGNKPSDFIITDKFNRLFLQNKHIAGDEIWRMYPAYTMISGKNIPLLAMDKYQFDNIYAERIKHSVDEHLEVMKDLKYARENNLINFSIENFVRGEIWKKIREIRIGRVKIEQAREDLSF